MKWNQLTAGLLALSMLGVTAPETVQSLAVFAEETASTSGTCGENLTWKFDESTGTLTISGTGEMEETQSDAYPWSDFKDDIQTVVIEDGVTSIGDYAFFDCDSLTAINVSDSVTSIGKNAFSRTPWFSARKKENQLVIVNDILIDGMLSSGDIIIPDGVKRIGDQAFAYCDMITSVTIPDSVISIGDQAFVMCTKLNSVTMSNNVTSIGYFAFRECYSLLDITIPDSVTSIGESAFEYTAWLNAKQEEAPLVIVSSILIDATTCSGDVTIPDGVTSIAGRAFNRCSDLTAVHIPDSVTSIGNYAFNGCSGLTDVRIPDSVTSMGGWIFYYCTSLTSVTISDSVTSIEEGAFSSCFSLTDITIPDSVTSIGESAFYGCFTLTDITILNPGCQIYDSNETLSNNFNIIHGYDNSTAQSHAEKYGYTFKSLGKAPETSTELSLGDCNADTVVDILDVIMVNKFLLGSAKLDPAQTTAADVDHSGEVDSTDSLNILKFVVKIISSFDEAQAR